MNQSYLQSQMASNTQEMSQPQTSVNQNNTQQAVQFQNLSATYNNSVLHSQTLRNNGPKPPVGSDEWLRQRRANHKEVERRRRETINEGINELAKLIPDDEKNKGRIIARAVQYIRQLKEQSSTNLEKWTLEKLLCEQAISELSLQVETLKHQNSQLKAQLSVFQQQQQQQHVAAAAAVAAAQAQAQVQAQEVKKMIQNNVNVNTTSSTSTTKYTPSQLESMANVTIVTPTSTTVTTTNSTTIQDTINKEEQNMTNIINSSSLNDDTTTISLKKDEELKKELNEK